MSFRKRRKDPPVNIRGLILLICVVVIVCLYAFYFVAPPAEKRKPAPPTRPKKPAHAVLDFTLSCKQLNHRIREFFANEGVPPRNYRIMDQYPVDRDGKRWLYTQAKVIFSRDVDAQCVATELSNSLDEILGLAFQWKNCTHDSCDLTIRTHDVLTHSLTIVSRPYALAIIIDDVGTDLRMTRELLNLGIPLTLSILPDLAYSKKSEELAHKSGYEVMLHLPMEPREVTHYYLGPHAIYNDMDRKEVHALVTDCVMRFPHIKGVNNHMGSLITENDRVIRWVLEAIKPHDLYFIDSRTSSQSVAYQVACQMGIPTGKNMVFLDNEPEVASCKNFIDKAIQQVKEDHVAIAIGHARGTTVQALKEMNQRIQDENITLVFVSELVQ